MKGAISDLNEMLKVGIKHLEEIEKLSEFSDKIKYIRQKFEEHKKYTSLQILF